MPSKSLMPTPMLVRKSKCSRPVLNENNVSGLTGEHTSDDRAGILDQRELKSGCRGEARVAGHALQLLFQFLHHGIVENLLNSRAELAGIETKCVRAGIAR